jgi:anti-sigma factor ChrR (cupin superfamily)
MHERLISDLANGWRELIFEPFRVGVDVHWIYNGTDGEPTVALLKYAPGAGVPRHRHAGLETIFVLDGAQSDENGTYAKGSFVLNPVGTEHSVWSDEGCVVLIQWDKPVVFVDP